MPTISTFFTLLLFGVAFYCWWDEKWSLYLHNVVCLLQYIVHCWSTFRPITMKQTAIKAKQRTLFLLHHLPVSVQLTRSCTGSLSWLTNQLNTVRVEPPTFPP